MQTYGNQRRRIAETCSLLIGSTVLQLVSWEGVFFNPRGIQGYVIARGQEVSTSKVQDTKWYKQQRLPAANAFLPPGLTLLLSSLAAKSNTSRSSRQRKQAIKCGFWAAPKNGHPTTFKRPIAASMTAWQLTLFVFAIFCNAVCGSVLHFAVFSS